MITRIEGVADNHALVFAPGEDGYWTAQVPRDLEDGVYYVTLTAWDAAGNSTYYATILLMVDAGGIRIAWQDGGYLLLTCSIGPEIYKTTAGVIVCDCH